MRGYSEANAEKGVLTEAMSSFAEERGTSVLGSESKNETTEKRPKNEIGMRVWKL